MHALLRLLLAVAALLAAMPAVAGDPCPSLRLQATAADVPTRIAAIACAENHAWYRSFIDADGRAGGQAVYEAENDTLAGGVQAWRKVASYWNGSGLPGSCASTGPACRSFVVDTPCRRPRVAGRRQRAAGGHAAHAAAGRAGTPVGPAAARRRRGGVQPGCAGVVQPQPPGLGGAAEAATRDDAGPCLAARGQRAVIPVDATSYRRHCCAAMQTHPT